MGMISSYIPNAPVGMGRKITIDTFGNVYIGGEVINTGNDNSCSCQEEYSEFLQGADNSTTLFATRFAFDVNNFYVEINGIQLVPITDYEIVRNSSNNGIGVRFVEAPKNDHTQTDTIYVNYRIANTEEE